MTRIGGSCCLLVIVAAGAQLAAQQRPSPAAAAQSRCIVIEVYVRGDEPASAAAVARVQALATSRDGLIVVPRDIQATPQNHERFTRVAQAFRVSDNTTPLVYACNRVISGPQREPVFARQLEQVLRLEMFGRDGCPRCAKAREYLRGFSRSYPGLEIVYREITRDTVAREDMNRLVAQHRAGAASVPVFHFCNRLVIGFSAVSNTAQRLEAALERWTAPCPKRDSGWRPAQTTPASATGNVPPRHPVANTMAATLLPSSRLSLLDFLTLHTLLAAAPLEQSGADQEQALPLPPPPSTESDGLDLPMPEPMDADQGADQQAGAEDVDLPVFGSLSVKRVGLPALTLAIGLVDGFNPCAMWVLLFLLSLLVNLQDRWRILAIAATFVVVSGLAYFAFMAAWLNVFLFVGYLRPIQIGLGLTAIAVGSIHIKDFFALHRGFSLSIPAAAKPSIYARTRQIITAENLAGALTAAIVLAVAVNIVELLCTAGLPALYTEILTMQDLPPWQNYAYLGLYNLAYMFDDTLMVGLVVITLDKRKLQERQGRWLKLVSGIVIALLGLIIIVCPDLLF